MLRVFTALSISLFLACSSDSPPPTSPTQKVSADDFPFPTGPEPAGKISSSLPKPTGLSVSDVTDTSAHFTWNTVNGATGYVFFYKMSLYGKWKLWQIDNQPSATVTTFQPETQYSWTIQAKNDDEHSDWAYGRSFTTLSGPPVLHNPDPYIKTILDQSITPREEEIIEEAIQQWEAMVASGAPQGIQIEFSTDVQMWVAGQGGYATIKKYENANGFQMPTECFVGLTALTEWNYIDYSVEQTERNFLNTVSHEIGHCFGIGSGHEWNSRVKHIDGWLYKKEFIITSVSYDANGNKIETGYHEKENAPIAPYFVGENAQQVFMRLAEGQWLDYPYVPLNWDRTNGTDPAHFDDPILSHSPMASSDYGNYVHQKISTLEAAILKDIGYTVDLTHIEDIRLLAGYRSIYYRRGGTYAVETLFYPESPLIFWPPENQYEEKGYVLPERLNREQTYIGDPKINEDNIFIFFD